MGSGWWLTGFVMARSQPREAEGEPSRVIIPKPSGFGAVSPPNFSRFGQNWALRCRLGDAEGFLFFRAFFQPWCLSRWPGAWKWGPPQKQPPVRCFAQLRAAKWVQKRLFWVSLEGSPHLRMPLGFRNHGEGPKRGRYRIRG